MRIAIDAMGGDHAPSQVVEGVALAVRASDPSVTYILVGDAGRIRPEMARVGLEGEKRVEIRHCADTIQMHEKISSLKAKPDASILRAAELMGAKEADAMVALGNTAAAVAATQLRCRLLEGVRRAGIAVPLPSMQGTTVVIDMGANVNAKPEHLLGYAVMASVYSKEVFKTDNPRVGLLNVGEEEGKGNGQLRETYALLEKAPVNFVGNVEGGDLFDGSCDVAVCDGFVGNVALKVVEGAASFFGHLIKSELGKTPIRAAGGLLCRSALKAVKDRTDYATYGGAPLLGVNGICIIGHGKSDARAVASALKVAGAAVAGQVNSKIVESLVG